MESSSRKNVVQSFRRKGGFGGEDVAEKADMLGLKVAGRQHWHRTSCPLEGSDDVGSHLPRPTRPCLSCRKNIVLSPRGKSSLEGEEPLNQTSRTVRNLHDVGN